MSYETIRQDVRRQLGPRMEFDGHIDELIRLRDRLQSGRSSQGDQKALASDTVELARKLDNKGLFDAANMLIYETNRHVSEPISEQFGLH